MSNNNKPKLHSSQNMNGHACGSVGRIMKGTHSASGELFTLSVSKSLQFKLQANGLWHIRIGHNQPWFVMGADLFYVLQVIEFLFSQKLKFSSFADAAKKIFENFPKVEKPKTQSKKNSSFDIAFSFPHSDELPQLLEDFTSEGLLLVNGGKLAGNEEGFGDPWIQWAMLCDVKRNSKYEIAINEISQTISNKISPGNLKSPSEFIALDIGSGTGLLSAMCVNAGAKKVFGIEESESGSRSQALVAQTTGKKGIFQVLKQSSQDADIQQIVKQSQAKTVLVVSELFGNDPFSEGIIGTLQDVFDKLSLDKILETFAIPESVECFVEEICLTKEAQGGFAERVAMFANVVCETPKADKKDFSNVFARSFCAVENLEGLSFPFSLQAKEFKTLGTPKSLGSISLLPKNLVNFQKFEGEKDFASLNQNSIGLLFWFRAQLFKNISISNHPAEKDFCSHWSPIYIPFTTAPDFNSPSRIQWQLNNQNSHLQINLFQKTSKTSRVESEPKAGAARDQAAAAKKMICSR